MLRILSPTSLFGDRCGVFGDRCGDCAEWVDFCGLCCVSDDVSRQYLKESYLSRTLATGTLCSRSYRHSRHPVFRPPVLPSYSLPVLPPSSTKVLQSSSPPVFQSTSLPVLPPSSPPTHLTSLAGGDRADRVAGAGRRPLPAPPDQPRDRDEGH